MLNAVHCSPEGDVEEMREEVDDDRPEGARQKAPPHHTLPTHSHTPPKFFVPRPRPFRVGRFVHHVGADVGTVFVGLSRLEPFTPRMQYDVLPYLSPSDSYYQIDTNQTSPVPEPRTT